MSDQKICPTCGTEYPLSERFCGRDGTVLRATSASGDLMGSIVGERYSVLRKLGEGGMGQVYLAEHVKMGRKSALKVMHPGMNQDADAIARFNREAANASRLNHPNICGIYDFGETSDGLIFLAMEFIEGQSLTSLVAQSGPLPPARAAAIILQSAEALQAAHDAGIVHRDLKPDNIMIARNRDGSDFVKVVDFGISKAHGSDAQKVTKTGLVVGTPEYMSPEQGMGDKLDGRSDIYSLGLVAFNCLTGKLPFSGESAQEAMIARLIERPKTLAEMRPDVAWPVEVQRVMDKALARETASRYASAAQFGRDLWAACERMPASRAATAGTEVLSSTPAGGVIAATHHSALSHDDLRIESPARDAAASAGSVAATAWAKVKREWIAAAVIVAGALGGGGYVLTRAGGGGGAAAPNDSTANQASQSAAPSAPTAATPNGASTTRGTTLLKKNLMNPAASGAEPAKVAAPPLSPQKLRAAAGLVKLWLPKADSITEGSAQRAIDDLEPFAEQLSGVTKGNAYYVLGLAYFKRNKTLDGCMNWIKARPLVAGAELTRINDFIDQFCK